MNAEKVMFRAEGVNYGLVQVVRVTEAEKVYYKVMRKRKMIDSCARFWELEHAIDRAVYVCKQDILRAEKGGVL